MIEVFAEHDRYCFLLYDNICILIGQLVFSFLCISMLMWVSIILKSAINGALLFLRKKIVVYLGGGGHHIHEVFLYHVYLLAHTPYFFQNI